MKLDFAFGLRDGKSFKVFTSAVALGVCLALGQTANANGQSQSPSQFQLKILDLKDRAIRIGTSEEAEGLPFIMTFFTASATQQYWFGQNDNPTYPFILVVFNGFWRGDLTGLLNNIIGLNIASFAENHEAIGVNIAQGCSRILTEEVVGYGYRDYCPLVDVNLVAGQQVSIALFDYGYFLELGLPISSSLPQSIYAVGPGVFLTDIPSRDIDAAYTTAQLEANQVEPNFKGGTLTVTQAKTFSNDFTVQSAGGTIDNAGLNATFSGVLSGSGGMTFAGAGVTTLTGANTYNGGTTVSAGTLRGTTTSLQGAIINNATTQFDQSTNGTYAGVMSGTGTLVKTGAGVLTLTGANTYSGGTTVSAGTLLGTTTSLQGAIINNATTQFDQNINGRYSGNMTGTGSLIKSGSGTTTLAGTVNIGGSTSILGGTLEIAGTVTTSALQCAGSSPTALSGNGRVNGAVTIGSGCTLAPGSSPGTLAFGGNLTMTTGSTFAVEIDGRTYSVTGGAGSYDRVVMSTSGTTFTAAGTLAPVLRGISGAANNNFTAAIGDRFTIVSGTNSGAFANVNQPIAGMPTNGRLDVLYSTSAIDLVITPNRFAVLGQSDGWTKNAISAAAGYDATRPAAGARTGDSLALYNLLYQTERTRLGSAFHQLSGQVFADAIQSARFTIEKAQDSILSASINDFASAKSGQVAVWADALRRRSEGESDGTALGYNDDSDGVALGFAYGFGNGSHIGLGASYGSSDVRGSLGSRADVDVKSFYVFGGRKVSDRWSYSLTAGVSDYDAFTDRELTLANATTRATGIGGGASKQIGAYLRFSQPVSDSSRLNLTGGLQAYWFDTNNIGENVVAADGGLTATGETWQQNQGVINAEWTIGTGRVRGSLFGEVKYDFDKDGTSDLRKITNNYGSSWMVAAPLVDRTQSTFGAALHASIGEFSAIRLEIVDSKRGDGFSDKGGFLRVSFSR